MCQDYIQQNTQSFFLPTFLSIRILMTFPIILTTPDLHISRGINIQLHPDSWLAELVKQDSTGCNWAKAGRLQWRMRKCAFVTSSQMREIVELILVQVWGWGGGERLTPLSVSCSSSSLLGPPSFFGLCISFAYICFQPRRPSAH